MRIQHQAAAGGDGRGGQAQDEAITVNQRERFVQLQLSRAGCAGREFVAVQEPHAGHAHRCAAEDLDLGGVAEDAAGALVRSAACGAHFDVHVDERRRLHVAGAGDHAAARGLFEGDAGEVDGDAAAGRGARELLLVGLQAAHVCAHGFAAAGDELDLVADGE
jgi:hypothetical protein